jgi:cystathionine beta-lyase
MIMLTPGYARYRQAATRLGRKTVESALILRRGRHTIDFEDLESKMADRGNKLFVLCNPNNPTGTVWNRDELKRISGLADRYGVVVFSDEIFAEIVFDGNETVPYVHAAGDGSAGITCTSLGKSFGLTGVNHANVVIPDPALRERFLFSGTPTTTAAWIPCPRRASRGLHRRGRLLAFGDARVCVAKLPSDRRILQETHPLRCRYKA